MSEEEYWEALKKVEEYLDRKDLSPVEVRELNILAYRVMKYEDKRYPMGEESA